MARTTAGRSLAVLFSVLLLMTTCVVRGPINVNPVDVATTVKVTSAVKAHLADGSTIVYPSGVSVGNGKLTGRGTQYDLKLKEVGSVDAIPLDHVVALESFENTTNRELTVLASSGATVAAIVGGAALAVAIFGSCPTVYSETGGEKLLEAELFSYSIAPQFELTDIDRLEAKPDARGFLQLEVRNEALETHYLNQLQLIEVRHGRDEIVVPDEEGRPLALRAMSTPLQMTDRRGRDVGTLLAARDDRVYRTDSATLAAVRPNNVTDTIELQMPAPAGGDEIALLFTMRNSLLSTVLLYDTMLQSAGARSLDWMSQDLGDPWPALKLATWYSSHMGMQVEVFSHGKYRRVAHIGDVGPIAWKALAVAVPVPRGESTMRIRLSFPADNWRIDQIQWAAGVRRPERRSIPIADVTSADGIPNPSAVHSLLRADDSYLQTTPGQSFRVSFDTGNASSEPRTFLVRSRGYYTEWIRSAWAASPTPVRPFTPNDDALLQTIQRWRDVQRDFEARFEATRLPVR